jgi:small-conductance mechanosensitive channel
VDLSALDIHKRFVTEGIRIPFPQREVHLSGGPGIPTEPASSSDA